MNDRRFSAWANLQSISTSLLAILVGFALWNISRPTATLASAGFRLESSQAWSFLIFCLGVAVLTMAFVQICRMLYPFRGDFHRDALERWLSLTADMFPDDLDETEETEYDPLLSDWKSVLKELELQYPKVEDALTEFEQRRGAASRMSAEANTFLSSMVLYDLPIEQLSGQLSLALEAGLDEPKRFKNLIVLTAGIEGATDLWKAIGPLAKPARNGEEQGENSEERGDRGDEAKYSEEALSQAQGRAAITRIVQLRMDAFQISTGGRWRYRLRLVVLAVSFVCSFIILFNSTADALAVRILKVPIQAAYSVVVGAIAGYLAMFLRDLIAIVENKRRRS